MFFALKRRAAASAALASAALQLRTATLGSGRRRPLCGRILSSRLPHG